MPETTVHRAKFGYNPALDGLRAVAIVGVVLGHAGLQGVAGYHGVTLFFVISGYLITSLLLEEHDRTGTIRFGHFYLRRFARLGPALLLIVLVTVTWLLAIREPLETWWLGAVSMLTYTTDLVQAVSGNERVGYYFQYAWSLSIEEQFYLLWPLALLLLLRFRSRKPAALFLTASIVFFWWARYLQDSHGPTHELQFYGPVSHADSLLVGCLLAIVLHSRGTHRIVVDAGRTLGPIGVLGLAYLAMHGAGFEAIARYDVAGFGQTALCSAAVVWWVAVDRDNAFTRYMSLSPLVLIGKLSYGIYLWNLLLVWVFHHFTGVRPWGTIWFLPWCIVLVGTAYLSWRFVETPLRRRWAPPHTAAVLEATSTSQERQLRKGRRRPPEKPAETADPVPVG